MGALLFKSMLCSTRLHYYYAQVRQQAQGPSKHFCIFPTNHQHESVKPNQILTLSIVEEAKQAPAHSLLQSSRWGPMDLDDVFPDDLLCFSAF